MSMLTSLLNDDLVFLAVTTPMQWYLTAGCCVLFLAAIFGMTRFFQMGNIARATFKESIRQPLFLLLLAVGILMLVTLTFLPFFSLGDDIKLLKDCGLATILFAGLLLAVWTSSLAISGEIEGKTAMTLLSKPINRRQFIVGKYFGIFQAALTLVIPMTIVFLCMIYFKVGYDAKESAKEVPDFFNWDFVISGTNLRVPLPETQRFMEVIQVLPAIVLVLLEIAVMAAISVAISTRLPMIVNMVSCLAIFIIGHLTPVLVKAGVVKIEFVKFTGQLIATALPALEVFNVSAAVATSAIVPPVYLGSAALYCAAYTAAMLLLAFILFEDRDLA